MLSSHRRLLRRAGLAVSKSLLSLRLNGINCEELLSNNAILSPAYKIQLNHCTKRQRNELSHADTDNIRAVTVTDNTRIPE